MQEESRFCSIQAAQVAFLFFRFEKKMSLIDYRWIRFRKTLHNLTKCHHEKGTAFRGTFLSFLGDGPALKSHFHVRPDGDVANIRSCTFFDFRTITHW